MQDCLLNRLPSPANKGPATTNIVLNQKGKMHDKGNYARHSGRIYRFCNTSRGLGE